jgi:hypothetical protein
MSLFFARHRKLTLVSILVSLVFVSGIGLFYYNNNFMQIFIINDSRFPNTTQIGIHSRDIWQGVQCDDRQMTNDWYPSTVASGYIARIPRISPNATYNCTLTSIIGMRHVDISIPNIVSSAPMFTNPYPNSALPLNSLFDVTYTNSSPHQLHKGYLMSGYDIWAIDSHHQYISPSGFSEDADSGHGTFAALSKVQTLGADPGKNFTVGEGTLALFYYFDMPITIPDWHGSVQVLYEYGETLPVTWVA